MFWRHLNENQQNLEIKALPCRASRKRETALEMNELRFFDIFLLSLEEKFKAPEGLKDLIDDSEYADMILQIVLLNPKNTNNLDLSGIYQEIKHEKKMPVSVSSCHPTAIGLRELLKDEKEIPETLKLVTSAKVNLKGLSPLFNVYLSDGSASIIQVKCTGKNDGHSFSLLKTKDNQIGIYEAWAHAKSNSSLRKLRKTRLNYDPRQCGEYESSKTCFTAIQNLMHINPKNRLDGLMTLSDAYSSLSEIEDGEERNIEITCVRLGNWIKKLDEIENKCLEVNKQFMILSSENNSMKFN